MKKISLDSLFRMDMSEEGIRKRREESYARALENPENMSYWFPKIESSTTKNDSILKLPQTKIVSLDFETWEWLISDRYTEEKVNEFSAKLNALRDGFLEGEVLFIKSGIFSNKFTFSSTRVENQEKIGQQFLDIFYTSMVVGADNTNEVVFREMIEDKENRKTIYQGMPLHTEFRVFYDFEEKQTIGISNYWHPEVMEKSLRGEDKEKYSKEKETIVSDFNGYKEKVIQEVNAFMDGVTGLKGKWSVDVMKNADDFWLIDMARMEKSALVKEMENIN